jgi:DNA-binding PadR family transcriptional regulator
MMESSLEVTRARTVFNFDSCTLYRGHLRLALLRCLHDSDMHGLEMINRIKEVTQGEWVPSPGSVYPVLQEFENFGLVKKSNKGRMVKYTITEKGKEAFRVLHEEARRQMDFMDWVMEE